MTDVALFWNADTFSADMAIEAGDLATDAGLQGALLVSLFTDARARADDVLPYGGADRRGWWGDVAASEAGDQTGSRLWLLAREKRTPRVIAQSREMAVEAVSWLVRDGIAADLDVIAEAFGADGLAFAVIITRPGGPTRQRFDFVWRGLSPS